MSEQILTEALSELVLRVHLARLSHADAKKRLDVLLEAWQREHSDLYAEVSAYGSDVLTAEAAVRVAAIAEYEARGEKRPTPGVEVKVFSVLTYGADRALAWALEHKIALTLDKKEFERLMGKPEARPEWVTELTQPRAQIATDLARFVPPETT